MLTAQMFIDQMGLPTTKLNVKELREREEFWRALWSWIDDDIKYYVLRVGQTVRVVRRDYKGSMGVLGAVKFDIKEIELSVAEKAYNYTDGKYYYEDKVVKIPYGAVTWVEFIGASEEVKEAQQPSLAALPNVEEVEKLS